MPASRIALDATYSTGRQPSGVGIYSRELLFGLARYQPIQRFVWAYRPHRFLPSFSISIPSNCRRRILWETLPTQCDLFHGLNQRLPAARYRRRVVTFHDLFVMTGEYSTAEFRARFRRQAEEAAQRADVIIAVSRFTASQVENLLKVPPSRLRVIPHGVHLPVNPPQDSRRENMVLFVGALQTRKNIVRLVRAFDRMPEDWRLVLAGAWGHGREEIVTALERASSRARIEVTGYVSDETLRALYARAAIFAFPSLDEGFGIPILEAMAYRVPVLTSNRSGCAEIGAGASLLVDPWQEEAIASGLRTLAGDGSLREDLKQRGWERACLHSWQRAAESTWNVYESVLS